MPALPPVPSVVRFVFKGTYGADLDVVNRFYQKYSGPPGTLDPTGANAWATAAAAAWAAHLAPNLFHTFVLDEVIIEDLSSATGATGTALSGVSGGSAVNATAAGVALVVQEKIIRRYRGGHPRQYICGIDGTNLATVQSWNPVFTATFQTAYTAFRAAVAGGAPVGVLPCVDVNVSYYQGFTNHTYPSGRVRPIPNLRIGGPLVDIINSFGINPKVASQRRRNEQSL